MPFFVRDTGSHFGCMRHSFIRNAMPVRSIHLTDQYLTAYKCLSYEGLVASWLLSDGWEVLKPMIDHGKKTDLVAADDNRYYRIQVKSIASSNETMRIENKWKGAKIDYVIYFCRSGNWGYIVPAFSEGARRLNARGHIRFHATEAEFLTAFRRA